MRQLQLSVKSRSLQLCYIANCGFYAFFLVMLVCDLFGIGKRPIAFSVQFWLLKEKQIFGIMGMVLSFNFKSYSGI